MNSIHVRVFLGSLCWLFLSSVARAELPRCENVFYGALSTTQGNIALWGSAQVIGNSDLNATNVQGGGSNCRESQGDPVQACAPNNTLSQPVIYSVPPVPPIPNSSGTADGTVNMSSGGSLLNITGNRSYQAITTNGYGQSVEIIFNGSAGDGIAINVAGSVTLAGNTRVTIRGKVTLIMDSLGMSPSGGSHPEIVLTEGASLVLLVRNSISLTNSAKINATGSPSALSIYANGTMSLPNANVLNGSVVLGGGLSMSGNSILNGSMAARSLQMSSDSRINGPVTLQDNLAISGNAQINGNVLAGSVHMSSSSQISGVAAVTGEFQAHDNSVFSGALVASGATATGNAVIRLNEGVDFTGICKDGSSTPLLDHVRLRHSGSVASCMAAEVEVVACGDPACNVVLELPGDISLATTKGNFGAASITVDEQGIGHAWLRNPDGGNAHLGANVAYQCEFDSGACSIEFHEAILDFVADKEGSELPPQIAGRPFSGYLRSITTNPETKACEARAEGLQVAYLGFSCERPAQCVAGETFTVEVTAIASNGAGAIANETPVSLRFEDGFAHLVNMKYSDAGEIQLTARLVLPESDTHPATELRGKSNKFISQPYGFCIQTAALDSDEVGPESPLFPGDIRAGDDFDLIITPKAWAEASEAQAPLRASTICANPTTPNYQQNDIGLELEELNGGHKGNLAATTHNHPQGGAVTINQSISEVGVFRLTATPPPYLEAKANMSHAVSQSGRVGRFIPASFWFEDPEVTPSCGSFTYAGLKAKTGSLLQLGKDGQSFPVSGVLSARNRDGVVTKNYKGSFAKLRASGITYVDNGNALNEISYDSGTLNAAEEGDGYLGYSSELRFRFDAPEGPHKLAIRVTADDGEGVLGSVVDVGLNPEGGPDDTLLPEFRLGVARVSNAHGSELQDLALPFATVYFNGSDYVPNHPDNCTVFMPATLGHYQRTGDGSGEPELVNNPDEPYQVVAGAGRYLLTAPGEDSSGSILLTFDGVPAWLQFDQDGDGALSVLDHPSGLATFGIYRGPKSLIFRREIYR